MFINMYCSHNTWEYPEISNSERFLELGVICYLGLKEKRSLGHLGWEGKLWDGSWEKYSQQGLLSNVCYMSFSLCFLNG